MTKSFRNSAKIIDDSDVVFCAKLLEDFQEMTNISSRKSECWIPFVERDDRFIAFTIEIFHVIFHAEKLCNMHDDVSINSRLPIYIPERTKVAFLLYVLPS